MNIEIAYITGSRCLLRSDALLGSDTWIAIAQVLELHLGLS